MTPENKTQIVWFKNDLRTHDNEALVAATKTKAPVVGVYFFEPIDYEKTPYGWPRTGSIRAQFILESLIELKTKIEKLGGNFLVFQGPAEQLLPELAKKLGASHIHTEREFAWEENHRVKRTTTSLLQEGIQLQEHHPNTLLHQLENISQTPNCFSTFRDLALSKNHDEIPKPAPTKLTKVETTPSTLMGSFVEGIPTLQELGIKKPCIHPHSVMAWKGGETTGNQRVENYLWQKTIMSYEHTRNGMLGSDYSSKLSPWLAQGCISAREIGIILQERAHEENASQSSIKKFQEELIFRDFFKHIAGKHQEKIFLAEGFDTKSTRQPVFDQNLVDDWTDGETQNPFINAIMRELEQTGFIGNRARQITASYFINELNQPWTVGAWWFQSQLVDFCPTQNWGNWLHASGNGTDRIANRRFNPELQAKKFDANGQYRRTWR